MYIEILDEALSQKAPFAPPARQCFPLMSSPTSHDRGNRIYTSCVRRRWACGNSPWIDMPGPWSRLGWLGKVTENEDVGYAIDWNIATHGAFGIQDNASARKLSGVSSRVKKIPPDAALWMSFSDLKIMRNCDMRGLSEGSVGVKKSMSIAFQTSFTTKVNCTLKHVFTTSIVTKSWLSWLRSPFKMRYPGCQWKGFQVLGKNFTIGDVPTFSSRKHPMTGIVVVVHFFHFILWGDVPVSSPLEHFKWRV